MNAAISSWFRQRGWRPFPFQRAVWKHSGAGRQGLIHAATGTGKTYAVWMAALGGPPPGKKLRVLWITPLRALAADTVEALRAPVTDLRLPWRIETRTGDTSSAVRKKQHRSMPNALITTPESLSLLLSYENAAEMFGELRMVVVDEWHEQLGSKRGVQTELALARLRALVPSLQTWALSATIGNLHQAVEVLLGSQARSGVVVEGVRQKKIQIDTILPADMKHFPWAGHLGASLLPQVLTELQGAKCSLVFTNTRSQAERWYQLLLEASPEWAGEMAIHHGSLSRETRDWVEENLRLGRLRCVVCTSSLDLGVDFDSVDRVLQIGSPKGVARLLQRAGRSGHQPGSLSRATCVPAHALELVEVCAAREAIAKGFLESRIPLEKPIDVLAQHLVTMACGNGFDEAELRKEVRSTYAYRDLTEAEWDWALVFVSRGGASLSAYPDYTKLREDRPGHWVPANAAVVRRHRLNIGTITGNSLLHVQFLTGGLIGHIEEQFVAGLQQGQSFIFGGKSLELIRVRDTTAWVRPAPAPDGTTPRWMGSRMPISSLLSSAVRAKLDEARQGLYRGVEMKAVREVLETQRRLSRIPAQDELLIETLTRRGYYHVFLYPFEGLLVHEGLAPLLAYRLSRMAPLSLTTTSTDYSIELVSREAIPICDNTLFSPDGLEEDIAASINAAELARRQFREVARVAGLTFQGYPGQSKRERHIQSSAGLLFDVLIRFDPGNLLIEQARREVLETHLEASRMRTTLRRLSSAKIVYSELKRGSPLCFPVLAAQIRSSAVTSETVLDRIYKLQLQLEKEAS